MSLPQKRLASRLGAITTLQEEVERGNLVDDQILTFASGDRLPSSTLSSAKFRISPVKTNVTEWELLHAMVNTKGYQYVNSEVGNVLVFESVTVPGTYYWLNLAIPHYDYQQPTNIGAFLNSRLQITSPVLPGGAGTIMASIDFTGRIQIRTSGLPISIRIVSPSTYKDLPGRPAALDYIMNYSERELWNAFHLLGGQYPDDTNKVWASSTAHSFTNPVVNMLNSVGTYVSTATIPPLGVPGLLLSLSEARTDSCSTAAQARGTFVVPINGVTVQTVYSQEASFKQVAKTTRSLSQINELQIDWTTDTGRSVVGLGEWFIIVRAKNYRTEDIALN